MIIFSYNYLNSFKISNIHNNQINKYFWPSKKHNSSELLNQSKLFAQNQKIKINDDVFESVYDTLSFKKKNQYTPLIQEQIFQTNAFVYQDSYQKNNDYSLPIHKKV